MLGDFTTATLLARLLFNRHHPVSLCHYDTLDHVAAEEALISAVKSYALVALFLGEFVSLEPVPEGFKRYRVSLNYFIQAHPRP